MLVSCTNVNLNPLTLSRSWLFMMLFIMFCLPFREWALRMFVGRREGGGVSPRCRDGNGFVYLTSVRLERVTTHGPQTLLESLMWPMLPHNGTRARCFLLDFLHGHFERAKTTRKVPTTKNRESRRRKLQLAISLPRM